MIGAIQYLGIDSKEGMTMSKHPSHKKKVKTQVKEAKRRVALGFGDQCLGIWAQWSHFQPNVEEDPLRVWLDLQNPEMVCPEIKRLDQ